MGGGEEGEKIEREVMIEKSRREREEKGASGRSNLYTSSNLP